ncbi:MAG: nucleotidyltransferase [Clostridia bacterium]|nr:nucleotidyltransferase [Clostridia bacterium]
MMKKTLVIMAAGLGSRFGAGAGQKQITPVDAHGQLIIDFSVYDAYRAGFEKVVFVIKPESRDKFHALIGAKAAKHMEVAYAYQELTSCLPDGFIPPEGRIKPWGTGHAALCAETEVPDGFVCINADDFYGRHAYKAAAAFLDGNSDESAHAMVGYPLRNTMTPNGSVARGVCETDARGQLTSITERTKIFPDGGDAKYTEDGAEFYPLSGDVPVSLNFWIFKRSIFGAMREGFYEFLKTQMPSNPLKAEFYLPDVPGALIKNGAGTFKVLPTQDKWFGMTYLEDLDATRAGVQALKEAGVYPDVLWTEV